GLVSGLHMDWRPVLLLYVVMSTLPACAKGGQEPSSTPTVTTTRVAPEVAGEIELVETAPVETTLDHPDVRDTPIVWRELIDRAEHTIDLSEFYASEPEGDAARSSRLRPVTDALEKALARHVRIRLLLDQKLSAQYPATVERLRSLGLLVKIIDASK